MPNGRKNNPNAPFVGKTPAKSAKPDRTGEVIPERPTPKGWHDRNIYDANNPAMPAATAHPGLFETTT